MVVINPNLPLGNVLNYAEMEKIVKFSDANKLALIVCESLQHSLYNRSHDVDYSNKASEGDNIKQENQFHSFRQVIQRLNSELELFSLNSISDGPFFQ
jgi:aspartate/methionine/tyrosine aminotransferase